MTDVPDPAAEDAELDVEPPTFTDEISLAESGEVEGLADDDGSEALFTDVAPGADPDEESPASAPTPTPPPAFAPTPPPPRPAVNPGLNRTPAPRAGSSSANPTVGRRAG